MKLMSTIPPLSMLQSTCVSSLPLVTVLKNWMAKCPSTPLYVRTAYRIALLVVRGVPAVTALTTVALMAWNAHG